MDNKLLALKVLSAHTVKIFYFMLYTFQATCDSELHCIISCQYRSHTKPKFWTYASAGWFEANCEGL